MTLLNRNTAAESRMNHGIPSIQPEGIVCESVGRTLVVNFTDMPIINSNRERRIGFLKKAKGFKPDVNRSEPIYDSEGNRRYFYSGDSNSKLGPAFIDFSQVPGYGEEIATKGGHVRTNVRGTCPYGVPCGDNSCYAIRAVKKNRDINVRYLEDNTILLREGHCREFADFICERARGHLAVRFNTYGDFVNMGHFLATVDVARRLPDKEVLAFTKAFDIVSDAVLSDGFAMPENYTLLLSTWNGRWPIPEILLERFPVAEYVSDPGQIRERAKVCRENCSTCGYCIGLEAGDWVYLLDHDKKRGWKGRY